MRKTLIAVTLCLVVGLFAGVASAQVSNMNEPGSLLVYPLIDNIYHTTIVDITNLAATDVTLACVMVTHGISGDVDEKKDFTIHLTQKEKFWWSTNQSYNRVDADGIRTSIQAFNGRKGYLFCWAVDSDKTQAEILWNNLKGDALLYAGSGAFQYNAIPSQGLAVVGDRVLNLDGVEYTMATSQIMFEGFSEGFSGIGGTLAVANIGVDFINSTQPEFDVNVLCWNQDEVPASRHLHYKDYAQYDLTDDLQLHINQIFTPAFQCATTSTNALWAVFLEQVGSLEWGGNVWQHPATGVPTQVVLPAIPLK